MHVPIDIAFCYKYRVWHLILIFHSFVGHVSWEIAELISVCHFLSLYTCRCYALPQQRF